MKQMKNKKIITVGGATFDMFVKAHDQAIMRLKDQHHCLDYLCLDYGGKVKVDEIRETFGGGATNTAVGFSRMGFDVCFSGKIGSLYGDRVLANLSDEGVNTAFAKMTKKDKTGFSVILNTFEGDRTVLAYGGANRFFTGKDLPLSEMASADLIFLNHLAHSGSRVPHEILTFLKSHPYVKLAWNPGHEQIEQGIGKWKALLQRTDYLFMNKEEASRFSRLAFEPAGNKQDDPNCHIHAPKSFLPPYADDVTEILTRFSNSGVKQVIITDGRNGAQATDGKRLYFCPVITHKRVDTLGAGDAFATGYTSGSLLGNDIKDCLKFGMLNASHVVSYFGAQEGLLHREKMIKYAKKLDICVTSIKLG